MQEVAQNQRELLNSLFLKSKKDRKNRLVIYLEKFKNFVHANNSELRDYIA